MRRTGSLRRTRGFRRPGPRQRTDREAARQWKASLRGQPCAVCGMRRGIRGHHILGRRHLKRYFPHGAVENPDGSGTLLPFEPRKGGEPDVTLDELLWDTRNAMALDDQCHARHESAFQRIPRKLLPLGAWSFARELKLTGVLEREYPA